METPVAPVAESSTFGTVPLPAPGGMPLSPPVAASPAIAPCGDKVQDESGVIRRFDSPVAAPAFRKEETAAPSAPWPRLAGHEWLLGADRLLKENRRAIALALLLATTCLLLLVINSGHPTEPKHLEPVSTSVSTQSNDATPVEPGGRPLQAPPSTAMSAALGPQGLAERRDAAGLLPSEPAITPIGPHFEARELRAGAASNGSSTPLPYPSTGLPERSLGGETETIENPSNVAIIRGVRPLR